MKLNKIFMLVGIAVAALGFSSCDSDEEYEFGAPATGNQLQAVTFGESNILSQELDPSDPTSIVIPVYRANADAAASVPVKIVSNDGVFSVPETVNFAAGEKESSIKVTFDKAEVGTNYSFEIAIDDSYVNPYSSATRKTFAYDVTRVKWNSLGVGIWIDDFWYGFMDEVEIFQREDIPAAYRFKSPYTDEVTGGGATYTPWINLNLTKNGYITWDKVLYINTFVDNYGAELKGYYPSALSSSLAASDELSYAEHNAEGGIRYFVVCPYWYMDGVGGYGTDYPCFLVFPGQDIPDQFAEEDEEE